MTTIKQKYEKTLEVAKNFAEQNGYELYENKKSFTLTGGENDRFYVSFYGNTFFFELNGISFNMKGAKLKSLGITTSGFDINDMSLGFAR